MSSVGSSQPRRSRGTTGWARARRPRQRRGHAPDLADAAGGVAEWGTTVGSVMVVWSMTGGRSGTCPWKAARSDARNSAASAKRSAGCRARARRTTLLEGRGMPARSWRGRSGAWWRRARAVAASVSATNGGAAAERLVEHDAEGVEVGAAVDRLALDLLGGQVLGGAEHGAGLGEVGVLDGLGDAEVGDEHPSVGGRAGCWPA